MSPSGRAGRLRVVVVGGGLAGITAALDCAGRGAEVTLIESRGRLGGQAYSFTRDGLAADNGQHVFLRCCTAYRSLVSRIGADPLLTLQDRLEITVLGLGGQRGRLARANAPVPLHLAGSLLRFPFLTVRERLSVAWAMLALRRVDVDDPAVDAQSFGGWLRAHGQSPRAVQALWELIVRPTVNLSCDDASLAQAAYVFQEGLLSFPGAGDLGHAAAPLSEIHDVAARRTLAGAGVEVRLRTGAAGLAAGPDGRWRVSLAGGSADAADHGGAGGSGGAGEPGGALDADAVVLAVGPRRAADLLPDGADVRGEDLLALGSSSIVNLHVVYDRPVLDVPFAAGVGTPVQGVFDRPSSARAADPAGDPLPPGSQYLVVTLSAADAEIDLSAAEIRRRYEAALAELLPAARGARVLRGFVTRDHAATFRAAPGARGRRPASATRLAGLALAGAYTDTGWPATMEGAVRSGHAAAEVVLGDRRVEPGAARLPSASTADPTSPYALR